MSNQYDLFPVDDATLDLLEAGIVNAGGEYSGLYSMLSFLSGNLDHDHDTAGCERVEPDVWVCIGHMNPEHTPQGVILALIAEVRRLRERAAKHPDRDGHGYPLDPNDPDYPPSAIAALTALNLASHRYISAGREGRIAVHTNEEAARRAIEWARSPEGARALHRFTDDELALLAQVTKDAESWSWDAESTWHGILAKIGAQPREDPR